MNPVIWTLAAAAALGGTVGGGALDPSFGADGVAYVGQPLSDSSVGASVAVQDDGRIVVCDSAVTDATGNDFRVVRFERDGTLDATFGTGGAVTIGFDDDGASSQDICAAVAVDAGGDIILVGSRFPGGFPASPTQVAVARLDAGGDLDTRFGDGGRLHFVFDAFATDARGTAVAVDAAGNVVIAADVHSPSFAVARLLPDGTFDPAFGSNGQASVGGDVLGFAANAANAVAIDSAGGIVVGGTASFNGAVVRLLDDGSLDTAFGNGGLATTDLGDDPQARVLHMIVDHAGRLVIAGVASTPPNGIGDPGMMAARFLADGARDVTFGNGGVAFVPFYLLADGGGSSEARSIVEQPDGKLVLIGQALNGSAITELDAAVARLDPDGVLDPAFGDAGKVTFAFSDEDFESAWLTGAAMQGGHVIAVGGTHDLSTSDGFVVRFIEDSIFADSFE